MTTTDHTPEQAAIAQAIACRIRLALQTELDAQPRHIVLGAAAATFVAMFAHYGQSSTVAGLLRAEADRLDRQHALDTAAAHLTR
ncbi:hypothetical protein Q4F19_06545 [Sphingomonas sp. BIUV-7]|uniref:Uncharacterized protein n=1 Tax=Sphingomonas natans TaxID=3063330 RepID=A0ABT8Y6V1_9SPHN|nr:hypothetical protein [Sphingomonas sp. BIUV-7]MDO6414034.1 hypothetical protein [Sphingomonas sp. BIUV-7]